MKHLHHIFRFIVAAVVCMAAAACVFMEEDGGRNNGGNGPKGDSNISLNLKVGTRSLSVNEDEGTINERMVNGVRMVLYGADVDNPTDADYTVKEVFDFCIRSKASGFGYEEWPDEEWPENDPYGKNRHLYKSYEDDPSTDRFVTFARKVPKRDYKMLIIINAQDYPVQITIMSPGIPLPSPTRADYENISLLEITEKGHSLAEFLTPAMLDQNIYEMHVNMARDKMFLMTNANGLIDVPADMLQATEDDANENPIPVSVDRAVAKIIVEGEPDYWPSVPVGGSVSNLTWDIQNKNRWFHWMRKQTYLIEAGAPGNIGQHETEVPDLNDRRGSVYAEDPNFSGISESNGGSKAGILENFHVIDDVGGSFRNTTGEHQYVFENTMAGDEQYDDVMTSVMVSCQYTPPGFQIWDDYFTYKGYTVSSEDIIAYYTGRQEPPSELQGIKEAITSVVDTIDGVDEWGEPVHRYMNIEEYAGDWYISANKPGFDAYGLRYYYQGYNYFKIAVRHGDTFGLGDRFAYGKYGVVRNYVYTVSINDIKLPGFPSTPDYGYVSAEIGIMDWATHELRETVGDDTPLIEEKPPGVTINIYHVVQDLDDWGMFAVLAKDTLSPDMYIYEDTFVDLSEWARSGLFYEGYWNYYMQDHKYSDNDSAAVGDMLTYDVDYLEPEPEDQEWNDDNVYLIKVKGYDAPDGTHKIYNFVILYRWLPT